MERIFPVNVGFFFEKIFLVFLFGGLWSFWYLELTKDSNQKLKG